MFQLFDERNPEVAGSVPKFGRAREGGLADAEERHGLRHQNVFSKSLIC